MRGLLEFVAVISIAVNLGLFMIYPADRSGYT